MKTQDFLDLLPIVSDREWQSRDGYIRDSEGYCPICALANEINSEITEKTNFPRSVFWLGISNAYAAEQIVDAADDHGNPSLRLTLMRALGMLE